MFGYERMGSGDVRMYYFIVFTLLTSPVFARDSTAVKDSIIRVQEKRIISLTEIAKSEYRRYEDLLHYKSESDSLHTETIALQRFYFQESQKQKPFYLALGVLGGVVLALTTILLIR